MLLTVGMIALGAVLGLLLGRTLVPTPQGVPAQVATFAVLGGAVALLLIDPSQFWAALGYLLAVLSTSLLYSAHLWQRHLAELDRSFAWFVRTAALHPGHLRDLAAVQNSPRPGT